MKRSFNKYVDNRLLIDLDFQICPHSICQMPNQAKILGSVITVVKLHDVAIDFYTQMNSIKGFFDIL